MGYPAGIGPEVIIKSLASPKIRRLANFLIIGDRSVFEKALLLSKVKLSYRVVLEEKHIDFKNNNIFLFDLDLIRNKNIKFGEISKAYGKASIEYLAKAMGLIKKQCVDLLITAPIHKYAAELAGFKYSGHTDYLARKTNTTQYAMMLAGGVFKVILATAHIPITKVSKSLSINKVADKIFITNLYLRKYFNITKPKIAVCGLNPHAGEDGTLGYEDKDIILPAIKRAVKKGINAIGPLVSDAVFYDIYRGSYDAVVCMYHDQGLIPLKMIARDRAINVTLGLPFIRISPAHGTALDISKRFIADPTSMKEAITTAIQIFKNKKTLLKC